MSKITSSLARVKPAPAGEQHHIPTVLVVDDTEAVRTVLRMQLKLLGYRVLEAGSGREAVELCAGERPDLILMDVSMPELDGLGATRLLRQDARTRYTPVVALSAFHEADFRECALAAGCSDFVSKPVGMNRLGEVVARYLPGGGDSQSTPAAE